VRSPSCAAESWNDRPANTYGAPPEHPGAVESMSRRLHPNCKRNHPGRPSDEIRARGRVVQDHWRYQAVSTIPSSTATVWPWWHPGPQGRIQLVGGPGGIDDKASDYRAFPSGADIVYFGGTTTNAGKLWIDLRTPRQ
jgi:hypothetical protein